MTLQQSNHRLVGRALASMARTIAIVLALAWPAQAAFAQQCPAGGDVEGNGFTRNLNGRDIDVLQSNPSTVTQ